VTIEISKKLEEILGKMGCLNRKGSLQDRLLRTLEYLHEIRNAADDAARILDEIEFVLDYGLQVRYCPMCEEPEENGHLSHCALASKKDVLHKCLQKMVDAPYTEEALKKLSKHPETPNVAYPEDDCL
jgi:hypothetical protein